jgi:hypothetical protein
MSALFPTFSNWLQRAKRLLSSDSRDIWQGIYEFIEQDEQAYQQRLQQKGIDFIL